MTDKPDITLREHQRKAGQSKSPRKIAALNENRKKRVHKQTPGAIYQRERRARLKADKGSQPA